MLNVGIAGASGYGGAELIHILTRHTEVKIVSVSSETFAGQTISSVYPHLHQILPLEFVPLRDTLEQRLDVLFLALPHGAAMGVVPKVDPETLVIDLSGDFRIVDPDVFADYYGFPMVSTDLQKEFVYGLTEINRGQLNGAKRISNPGCFATATLLGLYPLYQKGWIDGPVWVDSKTGSSGSGRSPSAKTHHPRRTNSLFPYKSFSHQHLPEIQQILNREENPLIFQTYSAPFVRGIFASHYMSLKSPKDSKEVGELFASFYEDEPFIRWAGSSPDLSSIQRSNYVDIGCAVNGRYLIVWSTLDNLQKGAAGQAVQNMNVALGFNETNALEVAPSFP